MNKRQARADHQRCQSRRCGTHTFAPHCAVQQFLCSQGLRLAFLPESETCPQTAFAHLELTFQLAYYKTASFQAYEETLIDMIPARAVRRIASDRYAAAAGFHQLQLCRQEILSELGIPCQLTRNELYAYICDKLIPVTIPSLSWEVPAADQHIKWCWCNKVSRHELTTAQHDRSGLDWYLYA